MKKTLKDQDLLKSFGQVIRQLRDEQKLSQEQLAFLAGLDRTYIGGIERGERNVALLNMARIADALKVNLSHVFAQREKKIRKTKNG